MELLKEEEKGTITREGYGWLQLAVPSLNKFCCIFYEA
jgi:hypothetical protein